MQPRDLSIQSSANLTALAKVVSLWRYRHLFWQLVRRDVIGRYRGSLFGFLWSFLHPLLMLAVFAFVFSVVFKVRWGTLNGVDDDLSFAMFLFAGIIVHSMFTEAVTRAPVTITSHRNFVKKVVFPLELLPWVPVGSAVFHALVGFSVLVAFKLAVTHSIAWTVLLAPLLLIPFVLMIGGFSLIFAAVGTYVRDLGQIVGVLVMVLLFLSPIFYPLSALPQPYRDIAALNPLTFVIEELRKVTLLGTFPDWMGLVTYLAAAVLVALVGHAVFQKARRGFADVV